MMLYAIHLSGVALGIIIGFSVGRSVGFDDATVVGSSHSVVTHMTVSDMTAEEFIMSDED